MAKSLGSLVREVYAAGANAYRYAIADQVQGGSGKRQWDVWEEDTAALLLLAWAAGAHQSLHTAGLKIPKPVAPVRFAEAEGLSEGLMRFDPGPAREAVERFMSLLPITRSRWDALIDLAFQAAGEMRKDEAANGLAKMLDRSPKLAELIRPALSGRPPRPVPGQTGKGLPQGVERVRTPGVQAVAQGAFFVTGMDEKQAEAVKSLLAKVIRQEETVSVAGKKLRTLGVGDFIEQATLATGTDLTAARLETVYRTNLNRAASQGQVDVVREPTVRKFVPMLQFSATKDNRTRPTHKAMDGYVATVEQIDAQGINTPGGFNCLPSDQPVEGAFDMASRALYRGPLVRFVTRSAHRVAATGGHPILTRRGWVPADQVKVGDQVLRRIQRPETASEGFGDDQSNHVPSVAAQVFDALAAQAVTEPTIGTGMPVGDFHGDHRFMQGGVHVVGADRVLVFDRVSGFAQEVADGEFVGAGEPHPLHRLLAACGEAPGLASDGCPCCPALPDDSTRLLLDPAPFQAFGLAPAALGDSPELQAINHDISGATKRFSDLLDALAGLVEVDDVVDVEVEPEWVGHVYDFRSSSGIIVADGIIVSNCRCGWKPIPIAVANAKGWCDEDGIPDFKAIARHNGKRQALIDGGQFPDPGFVSG